MPVQEGVWAGWGAVFRHLGKLKIFHSPNVNGFSNNRLKPKTTKCQSTQKSNLIKYLQQFIIVLLYTEIVTATDQETLHPNTYKI